MIKNQIKILILFLFYSQITFCDNPFSGASICEKLYKYILTILPKGKTIVELGSGRASEELSKHYNVYSIEHDEKWLNKYNTHYIYAPLKNGWYDIDIVKKYLPKNYDLILVDGPPGFIGRYGFFKNINLFKLDLPIIFDDVHRNAEYNLMIDVSNYLKRSFKIFECKEKKFGVLNLK